MKAFTIRPRHYFESEIAYLNVELRYILNIINKSELNIFNDFF